MLAMGKWVIDCLGGMQCKMSDQLPSLMTEMDTTNTSINSQEAC